MLKLSIIQLWLGLTMITQSTASLHYDKGNRSILISKEQHNFVNTNLNKKQNQIIQVEITKDNSPII